MMMNNELIYCDFILDEHKPKINEWMDRLFEGITFCPVPYHSLRQAVLEELQGREEEVKERALALGEPWLMHETYITDKARMLIRRIASIIESQGKWEPVYAHKIMAQRLVNQSGAKEDVMKLP